MNFGIIGYGKMGKIYKNALESLNIKIDFICDILETQKEQDIQFYSDYSQAFKNSNVDGIIVSTYGPTHYEIIKKAIDRKIKYIICEKPFTTSVKHATELIEQVNTSNTRLTVNYSRRFSEAYSNLKNDLTQKNIIGQPRSMIITCGAGGLSAVGTHFFDLCSFLLDSPVKSIYAFSVDKNLPNPRGKEFRDPGGYVVLNFRNDSRAFLDLGDDLGINPLIEIIGEYGRIIINEMEKEITITGRNYEDKKKSKHLYALPNPKIKSEFLMESLDEMIKNMIQNVISKSDLAVTAHMAKEKVEIYSAVRKSFDSGKMVSLPLDDEYYEKNFMVT